MSHRPSSLLLAFGLFPIASPALGQGTGYILSSGCDELATMDLRTGGVTLIGDIGRDVHAIALAPDGRLFGVDPTNDELVEIDVKTGQGMTVASLNVDLIGVGDLTFDADGRLWMSGSVTAFEWDLLEVDLATGRTTLLGKPTYQGAPIPEEPSGLAAAGDMLLISTFGRVLRVDPTSLELSDLSPALLAATGDHMDLASDGSVWIATLPGGLVNPPEPREVLGYDPLRGRLFARHRGIFPCGLAITEPQNGVLPAPDVPALSAIGVLILAGLMLVFGMRSLSTAGLPGRI